MINNENHYQTFYEAAQLIDGLVKSGKINYEEYFKQMGILVMSFMLPGEDGSIDEFELISNEENVNG